MDSIIEPNLSVVGHSTLFSGLVAAGRLHRLRRVQELFDSCVETRANRGSTPQPQRNLAIVPKLMALSLCAMLGAATLSLTGCAQFENSFGELRGPIRQSVAPTISKHSDPTRSNDISNDGSYATTSGDTEWSYTLSGLSLELAPGAVTQ